MEPWFLYGVEVTEQQRKQIMELHRERLPNGKPKNAGWPNYVRSVLDDEAQAMVEQVHRSHFDWEGRKLRLTNVIRNLEADILSLVECDHYEDFFKDELRELGYESIWQKRPRPCSYDGCCIAWRTVLLDLVATHHFEYTDRFQTGSKDRIALFALLKFRLTGETLIVASTHLARNPEEEENDRLRARQVGQLLRQLAVFAKSHDSFRAPVILLGDLNAVNFDKLRCISSAVSLLEQDRVHRDPPVHPIAFDCHDAPTASTSVTKIREMCIDRILYQGLALQLLDITEAPQLNPGEYIPNSTHPSDHLPVRATFQLKTRLQRTEHVAREWFLQLAGRATSVALNAEQLRDAFNFYDRDCDGVVSRSELHHCLVVSLGGKRDVLDVHSSLPQVAMEFEEFTRVYREAAVKFGVPGLRNQDVTLAFSAFDADASGTLELNEMLTAFAECCPAELSEKQLQSIFLQLDIDGDGHVSLEHFGKRLTKNWHDLNSKRCNLLYGSTASKALSSSSEPPLAKRQRADTSS